MAWPSPFRRRNENTRTCWGYTFDQTPEHLTPEASHPLKFSYDTLGEECLDILNEISPVEARPATKFAEAPLLNDPALQGNQAVKSKPPPRPKRDLYQILVDNKDQHPKLQKLWSEVTTVPSWVDWDQIARGQDVFYRYGGATLTGLAYQSLLGGMGANRVVEVLSRTGGFNVKQARHRLFETTQHILECTRSLESIQPLGAGFASSLRVRLLHAAVRQRILRLAKSHPGYYDVSAYGIPINDLDSIATIATFSATILFISLPRQGIFPTTREIHDYIALWRLIALYTGTPTEPFATPTSARQHMESLMMNEIDPSPTSALLANNIIRALENIPPAYASRSFLEVNARWLNGNELCDALELGKPSAYYWCLMAGQCLFFMGLCYTYRSFETLDRRKVGALKKAFWEWIVEGKYGLKGEKTVFELKYVPELGVGTTAGREDDEVKLDGAGVEGRSLRTLVVVVVGFGLGCWVMGKVVRGMVGMVI